jgi:hypothetical protein
MELILSSVPCPLGFKNHAAMQNPLASRFRAT